MTSTTVRCDDCGAATRETPDGASLRPHRCAERQRAQRDRYRDALREIRGYALGHGRDLIEASVDLATINNIARTALDREGDQ